MKKDSLTRHKGPGRDSTGAAAIATAERHAEWLKARRHGKTYRAIAAEYGVTPNAVLEAVSKALAEVRDEPASDLIRFELDCLDELIEQAFEAIEAGELDKIEQVRKLRADRRKVLGLDAPTKLMDVTPPREELWTSVRGWLEAPSEELARVLAETGWVRK